MQSTLMTQQLQHAVLQEPSASANIQGGGSRDQNTLCVGYSHGVLHKVAHFIPIGKDYSESPSFIL